MTEHIKILNKFKENPYRVLDNDKENAKLIAAINKSIKLLQKSNDRKNSLKGYY
jgi:hypothetical protein